MAYEKFGVQVSDPFLSMERLDDAVERWVDRQNGFSKSLIYQTEEDRNRATNIRTWVDAFYEYAYPRNVAPLSSGAHFAIYDDGRTQHNRLMFFDTDGQSQVVYDPSIVDPTNRTYLSGMSISPEEKYVALYLIYRGGDSGFVVIIDAETKTVIDEIPYVIKGQFAWSHNEGYIRYFANNLFGGPKLMLHKVGNRISQDIVDPSASSDSSVLFFDPAKDLTLSQYRDGRLIIKLENREVTSSLSQNANVNFVGTFNDRLYYMRQFRDENTWNYELLSENPTGDDRNLIRHFSKPEILVGIGFENGKFFTQNRQRKISVYDLQGEEISQLETNFVARLARTNSASPKQRVFVYATEFRFPSFVYSFIHDSNSFEVQLPVQVPEVLDPNEYTGEVRSITREDGSRLDYTMIYKREIDAEGNPILPKDKPTILHGYGGFSVNIQPSSYDPRVTFFLKNGGVFVYAHIRGNSQTHDQGRLLNKQNVFDDFIAVGRKLVSDGVTSTEKLASYGGSNGGLLTGATLLQAPDLFKAAVVSVGVLDMIRFPVMGRDAGQHWVAEYGNPDEEEHFQNLMGYSPYHNVKPNVDYPITIVTSGSNDERVNPAHSYKFVARMQTESTSKNPILLINGANNGHSFHTKAIGDFKDDFVLLMTAITKALGMEVDAFVPPAPVEQRPPVEQEPTEEEATENESSASTENV